MAYDCAQLGAQLPIIVHNKQLCTARAQLSILWTTVHNCAPLAVHRRTSVPNCARTAVHRRTRVPNGARTASTSYGRAASPEGPFRRAFHEGPWCRGSLGRRVGKTKIVTGNFWRNVAGVKRRGGVHSLPLRFAVASVRRDRRAP